MQNFFSGMAAKAKAANGATRSGGKSAAEKKPASKSSAKKSPSGDAAAKNTSAKPAAGKTAQGGKSAAKTSGKAGTQSGKPSARTTGKSTGKSTGKTAAGKAGTKPGKAGKTPAAGKAGAKSRGTGTGSTKSARAARGADRAAARDAALTRHQLPLFWRVLILLGAFVGMVAFAVVLSKLTLNPSAASESLVHSNLRPGDSIRAYLAQPAIQDTLKQLGGNIVLGMPFGVLLPALVPRTRGLLRVMVATALVMLLVELVQGALVQGRAFDIDDVILNTTGAMLGYLILGLRIGRAVHPRRRHWWHRKPRGGSLSASRSVSPQSPSS